MTGKQKIFCDEYLICNNATEAAIKAGYSKKRAKEIGYQLLHNTTLSEHIEAKRKRLEIKSEITQERIIKEFGRIATFDVRKLFDEEGNLKKIVDLDDDTAAAIAGVDISTFFKKGMSQDEIIQEVTKKVKAVDKKGALDSLARIRGMFNDKAVLMTFEDWLKQNNSQ
jgi:phage terminase small subunit